MKRLLFIFVFWISFLPAQNDFKMVEFPKIKSSVNIPVRLHLSEVSHIINQSVNGLIYDDDSFENNNNDQSKTKVWKNGDIEILGGKNQNLIIKVPLKIWVKKGIGTMGVYTYQETTFETEMYFSSEVELKNNWSIKLTTTSKGFKWIQKPVLNFGMVKIPVTSFVEKPLKEEQEKFCKIIDDKANENLNFRKYATSAWNLFAKPMQISEEYNTWLKLTPLSLNVSPLIFYKDAVDFKMGLDIFSETYIGSSPNSIKEVIDVDDFHFSPDLEDEFLLQTTANISYEEATRLAKNMFLNQEYDLKGKKVKITDINVSGEADKVIITAKTEGALNGISTISGIPIYDEAKKKIVLVNTEFQLKTNNILHKALAFIFKGKIIKKIEEDYGIPTQDMIYQAEKNLIENFNKEHYKGVKTVGQVIELYPSSVVMTPLGITTIIDVKAKLNIIIKNL